MRIRVFEAFAGYGSQMMALRRVSRRHAGGKVYNVGGDISNSYEQPRRNRLYRRAVRGAEGGGGSPSALRRDGGQGQQSTPL